MNNLTVWTRSVLETITTTTTVRPTTTVTDSATTGESRIDSRNADAPDQIYHGMLY